MPGGRTILHVDMDAFFASVEQLDHPEWRGRPVLVGGGGRRGVVSTASYEARAFGCRSAMPTAVALRLCPHAVVAPIRGWRYRELSDKVFEILERFSPLVEPIGIDEGFLDVSGTEQLFGDGVAIARSIRKLIREEMKLTASVGVAPNKFLAKLASDLNKPDGLTVITHDTIESTLSPLPVGRLWGVGPKAVARLARMHIHTIGELRAMPDDFLFNHFGAWATRLRELIAGVDDRAVTPDHHAKSVGHEQTFGEDLHDPDALRAVLLEQVEAVAARLRRHKLLAKAVQVKLRTGEFRTMTRRTTLPAATDATAELWPAARKLFDDWANESLSPLRLIGFACSELSTARQLGLFDEKDHERRRAIDAAVDAINQKHGQRTIRRGGV